MTRWTFADAWYAIARRAPTDPALVHGDLVRTWGEFDSRAAALAAALRARGVGPGTAVALYLPNRPEYLESLFGLSKMSAVPVNTNFRYRLGEVRHVFQSADVRAVIFDPRHADVCEGLRAELPAIERWIALEPAETSAAIPGWADPYETLLAGASAPAPFTQRSGDDSILLFTGGTTGLPKGVIWRQDTLYRHIESVNQRDVPDAATPQSVAAALPGPGPKGLVLAPLMHGTGLWFSLPILNMGGSIDTTGTETFDARRALDVIAAHGVERLCVAGDAIARPLVEEIERNPGRWDLGHLAFVFSSGMVFSPDVKQRLLAAAARGAVVVDAFGSSEAGGLGRSITTLGAPARFRPDAATAVIEDDGAPVAAGSGRIGRLVGTGLVSSGYLHADDGPTYLRTERGVMVATGDLATIEADGTIVLVGRGSSVVNTGGEKVFAEEVEEVLRTHPDVLDVVVVGVPDPRFGHVVTAVVLPAPDRELDPAELITHVKATLAGYKAPRHVVAVDHIPRDQSGKVNRTALQALAAERVSAPAS